MHIISITFFQENPISMGVSLWTVIISRTLRIRIRLCTGIIWKTGACSELWISTRTKRYLNSIRSSIFTCRTRSSSIVSFPAMREEPEVRDIGIISRRRKIFRYFWIWCLLMGIMIPAPSCR